MRLPLCRHPYCARATLALVTSVGHAFVSAILVVSMAWAMPMGRWEERHAAWVPWYDTVSGETHNHVSAVDPAGDNAVDNDAAVMGMAMVMTSLNLNSKKS